MPALVPSDHQGTVTWLGLVPTDAPGVASVPQAALRLGFDGVAGDRHQGLTRPSCSRVTGQHPRGTEIRNTRQLAIVAAEDLAAIASGIGLASLDPGWLGSTVVLAGIPDLSYLPPGSRLQGPDGVTLVVDMENLPCVLPGREIEAVHPGLGRRFKAAAKGRRGLTAWVERPGTLQLGASLRLHLPAQRGWHP